VRSAPPLTFVQQEQRTWWCECTLPHVRGSVPTRRVRSHHFHLPRPARLVSTTPPIRNPSPSPPPRQSVSIPTTSPIRLYPFRLVPQNPLYRRLTHTTGRNHRQSTLRRRRTADIVGSRALNPVEDPTTAARVASPTQESPTRGVTVPRRERPLGGEWADRVTNTSAERRTRWCPSDAPAPPIPRTAVVHESSS